jgi:DNA invertase Pin-like site-specific DNA recombinase
MGSFCIYLRKSRADADAEARGEGETLARHEATLRALAEKLSLPVITVYREIVSGETIAARPVMRRLLQEVEAGIWEGVLVMEVERLARGDTIDQGVIARAFSLSHTRIITPLKTYDPDNESDEEYFEFGLFMSRREYKAINRRLQRGRKASAMEGKYTGSIAPYGYARVRLEGQKGFTLAPDPEEAPVVRLIFALYTRGEALSGGGVRRLGVARLARRLNVLGIRPRRAEAWTPASLLPILKNPVYAGKIRWRGRPAVKAVRSGETVVSRPRDKGCTLTDGLHPPLIGPGTWERAQTLLAAGHPRGTRDAALKNPLAGLVFCGLCGRKMVRKPLTEKSVEVLLCPGPGCRNVSADLRLVEARVLWALDKWLTGCALHGAADAAGGDPLPSALRAALRRTDEALARVAAQTGSAHDLLEQGVYSAETFSARQKALAEKAHALERAKAAILAELNAPPSGTRALPPQAVTISQAYVRAASIQAKNDLLKSILARVQYVKAARGGRGKTAPFTLTLHPRLPRLSTADKNAVPTNWPIGK